MYRSFVTCDDPKGVVECRTIRKSKSGSQKMEHKIVSRKGQKNSSTSLALKAEKEEMVSKDIIEEYNGSSSFQLLEISRGAQKLNQMIESWSNGLSYDGHSKDITKDLFKGALDVQESLNMLGRLQEATQYMARLEKKQKERSETGRTDEVEGERKNSHRFGGQNYQMGFSKPRLSTDGSSGDCIEELKKAIRDRLTRQNVISTDKEKTCFERRKMECPALDVPSTNSSQLSTVQSSDSHSTDSSILETVPIAKGKGPNLIAKLMGLEDIPSKPLEKPSQKQPDIEKTLSQQRPVFDIEMPKVRKTQPLIQKTDSEQRRLKEILETVQFKGLLKSGSTKELQSRSHQSSGSHSRQRSIDDMPPIVLIKPCVPCLESKEVLVPRVWKEGALNTKAMLRKMKVNEWFALGSIDYKEGTLNASKMHSKVEAEETPIKRLNQEEGAKDHRHREVVAQPEEKEVKMVVQKEGVVNANKMHRKPEAEETLMKRLCQKGGAKDHKELVVQVEEEKVETKLKGSSKMKASSPVTQQRQRKETTDKKVDKIQKVVATSGKPVEREIVKPKTILRSQDQAKVTSAKLRKPENASVITKTQIPQQYSNTLKTKLKHTAETAAHNSKDRKKKEKSVDDPAASKLTTKNLGCKEDDKRIDLICDNDSALKETTIMLADQLSKEEEVNNSTFETEGRCSDSQNSICNVTFLTSENEKGAKSSEEVDDHISRIRTDSTSFKTGTHLKALLLSSPSFVAHAEKLFHLNTSCLKILPASGICDSSSDIELSLDYANEFIERRSLPDSRTRHPLLPIYVGNSRISLSLDQLVEEVCNGVETLRSYHNLACGNNLQTDSMYATLDRDMRCKELVSGTWDLGWRNGYSVEEAEQTVNDLEKLLVSELIVDVFT